MMILYSICHENAPDNLTVRTINPDDLILMICYLSGPSIIIVFCHAFAPDNLCYMRTQVSITVSL